MRRVFDDNDRGCAPAIMDVATGKPMSDDSPVMRAILQMWKNDTTLEQRKAFWEFTYNSDYSPEVMEHMAIIQQMIQQTMKSVDDTTPPDVVN